MSDPVMLAALRKALTSEDPVRLVSAGKRPEAAGLFLSTAKKNAQAIEVCLDKEQPLLEIVREEAVKAKVHRFVILNERGIDVLVSSVPAGEFEELMAEAAPRHRAKLAEKCLLVCRQHLADLATQLKQVSEVRQQTMAAAQKLAEYHLEQIEVDHQRLDRERVGAADAEARLRRQLARPNSPSKAASRPTGVTAPRSEEELNYQRDISEELVHAWREAELPETKEALARTLFNVGVERVGEPGEQVPYDGRWQHTEDELNAGEVVEVVRPGWRLVNSRGTYLITRAVVRKALRPQEITTCQP